MSDAFSNNMNLFEEDKTTELNFGTGIEPEDTGSEDEITEPFDTTQIRVETKPSNIDLLLSRIRHAEIDLAPGFQRKGGIWKDSAQSRLIESLLIRIPIPAFYMDATDEDKWLVVDGLQRLTALKRFIIDQDLKLSGLEFLTQLHGKRYSDLPRNFQRRISETQVVVYLIEKGTPPEVKFNIFKRINTGGLPLSSQEIRHALNQGVVTEFLARLAASTEFKVATRNSIRDDRMGDRECVLRFLAFAITPYTEYKSKDLDSFLNDSMREINHMPGARLNELGHRFLRAMMAAHDIFQETAFRKPGRVTMNPINKPLFEAVSVNLDRLNDDQLADLKGRSSEVKLRFKDLINDRDFEKSISVSTGNVSTVRYRFSKIELLLQDVLL